MALVTQVLTRPRGGQLSELGGMLTVSPQMKQLFRLIERVARSEASVLIRGGTGTGKELVARALFRLSARKDGPFRAINCATLTPDLLASELFGHVRGAFTGAVSARRGLFALADQGTVFLDEIAEIPLDIQASLLRVLQEQTFVPLGGTDSVRVDVRVLSATNKALRDEVNAGRFREDLMYRVRVIPLFLPPLSRRDGDIEALTWHFIDEFNRRGPRRVDGLEQRAMDALLAYPFPGNVRELLHVVEYAFVVGEGPLLSADELPPELRGEPPPDRPGPLTVDEQQRERILSALYQSGGHKGNAAKLLNISRSTLWRKLREYRLD